MPTLTLIIGPQAAGKTTVSKQKLAESPHLIYICSDLYWPVDDKGRRYWLDHAGNRYCWYKDPIPSEIKDKAYSWARHQLIKTMSEQNDAVFESTLVDKHTRKRFIQDCFVYGYDVDAIFLYPSLLTCAKRNSTREHPVPDAVLARTYAKIEAPTEDEGFYKLKIIRS
jgi:predicted kinase